MRFILEFEALIADVMPAWYAAHRDAAGAVGWSCLDEPTFRRLTRTKGREADLLPGAKKAKIDAYESAFAAQVERDALIGELSPQPKLSEHVRQLRRFGPLILVTLGENIDARRRWLDRQEWGDQVTQFERLDGDPRRRPVELRVLADGDQRAVAAAGSDALARSADAAEIFTVGVSSGPCSLKRLQQAGVRVAYRELAELTASLKTGAADLVRAGLLPIV